MFKNVASQKIALFALDSATGKGKPGDAANITAYVSKDSGAVTVLGDTSATEMDATNAKGWYLFDLTQGETNGDQLLYSGKSSTSGIEIVGQLVFAVPPNFTSLSIASAGRVDANMTFQAGVAVPPRYIGTALGSGGGINTIALANGTSSLFCEPGDIIVITSGTGVGQTNTVLSTAGMGGATPIATMVQPWYVIVPDSSSVYEIIKLGGLIPAVVNVSAAGYVQADAVAVAGHVLADAGIGGQNIGSA